jgi:AraC-like DNA-binding protein
MLDTFLPAPYSALHAAAWPAAYQRHAQALALLRKPAGAEHRHLSLPLDLYVVTVYCDPALRCAPNDERLDLEVAVSALRTKPAPFVSSGGGELAVALLTPLGLLQVFRTPMEGLVDRRLPLAYFVGWTEQRRLRDTLLLARDAEARMQALGAWLERRITDPRPLGTPMARVAELAEVLQHHEGALHIERFAQRMGIGRRQIERDFARWLGVSPGQFLRVVRFQRAAAAVLAGDSLTGAAADHGYADQAHMTRTFGEMAGTTPGRLAAWRRVPWVVRATGVLARRVVMGHAEPAGTAARAVCTSHTCAAA